MAKKQPKQRLWIAWRRFDGSRWEALAIADDYVEAWKYVDDNPSQTVKNDEGMEVPVNTSVVLEEDEHPLGWCKPPKKKQ